MDQGTWYLVAYDVCCPRRLQRVHRLLKGRGLAVQYSVFFVFGTERALVGLLDEMDVMIHTREDNVIAWPITAPAEVWIYGQSPPQGLVLPESGQARTRAPRGWLGRLRSVGRGR